jgi:hypothetical protein
MPTDLSVNVENEPGALARVGEALGNAGINIDGVAGVASEDGSSVHILVPDGGIAREALREAGIECGGEREVEIVSVVDQPGELGRHLRRVAEAGVNVDLVYLATGNRLVIGAEDGEGLRQALHG